MEDSERGVGALAQREQPAGGKPAGSSGAGVSKAEVKALGLFYGTEKARAFASTLGWAGAVAQLHRELAEQDQNTG